MEMCICIYVCKYPSGLRPDRRGQHAASHVDLCLYVHHTHTEVLQGSCSRRRSGPKSLQKYLFVGPVRSQLPQRFWQTGLPPSKFDVLSKGFFLGRVSLRPLAKPLAPSKARRSLSDSMLVTSGRNFAQLWACLAPWRAPFSTPGTTERDQS